MNKNKKGLLIIFSGPSGSGKGTIMKSLLASREDTVLSVSMAWIPVRSQRFFVKKAL